MTTCLLQLKINKTDFGWCPLSADEFARDKFRSGRWCLLSVRRGFRGSGGGGHSTAVGRECPRVVGAVGGELRVAPARILAEIGSDRADRGSR